MKLAPRNPIGIKDTWSNKASAKGHHIMLHNYREINIGEEVSAMGLIPTYLYKMGQQMWLKMVPTIFKEFQCWCEKHLWGTASIIYFWNFVAVYIYFEINWCILVINSCCLWILIVRFRGTIVIVENSVWFGYLYIFLYTCVNLGGPCFYWGIPVHIYFSDKYLFILGTSCTLWVLLPTFKGGS